MAILTNGKGDVLELAFGHREMAVIAHTNDGASTETRYPPQKVHQFVYQLFQEYEEARERWMQESSQPSSPETGGFLDPTNPPQETSGPTIG
jgi:hypothetical protein